MGVGGGAGGGTSRAGRALDRRHEVAQLGERHAVRKMLIDRSKEPLIARAVAAKGRSLLLVLAPAKLRQQRVGDEADRGTGVQLGLLTIGLGRKPSCGVLRRSLLCLPRLNEVGGDVALCDPLVIFCAPARKTYLRVPRTHQSAQAPYTNRPGSKPHLVRLLLAIAFSLGDAFDLPLVVRHVAVVIVEVFDVV